MSLGGVAPAQSRASALSTILRFVCERHPLELDAATTLVQGPCRQTTRGAVWSRIAPTLSGLLDQLRELSLRSELGALCLGTRTLVMRLVMCVQYPFGRQRSCGGEQRTTVARVGAPASTTRVATEHARARVSRSAHGRMQGGEDPGGERPSPPTNAAAARASPERQHGSRGACNVRRQVTQREPPKRGRMLAGIRLDATPRACAPSRLSTPAGAHCCHSRSPR